MVPFPHNCKRCLELARANTANPFPPNHREPRTVAYQTIFFDKKYAISAWPVRWHASRRTIWPSPPPKRESRTSHKIKDASRSSRRVATTVVRLMTGRVFVCSYTARFHPHKGTTCPACRVNPQIVEHVIKFYPRYEKVRAAYLFLTAPDISLLAFFGGIKKDGNQSSLKVTKGCFPVHMCIILSHVFVSLISPPPTRASP